MSMHDFNQLVEGVREAIACGIYPHMNVQGSSGSYFCKRIRPLEMDKLESRQETIETEVVGIFKPKDEEPYGKLNPKWTKWLHRNCFPCFFGRSW
jgi:phosphatidylinositol 4-kinase type 2